MAEEMPLYTLASAVEQRYKEQFSDALENWRGIETKAQGLVAIAGILLAGIFAIVSAESFAAETAVRLALAASIVSLTVGLINAVLVLRMRDMRAPPQAKLLRDMLGDIAKLGDDAINDEVMSSFIQQQFDAWENAVDDMKSHIQSKARDLRVSVFFILAALLLLTVPTLFTVAMR